MIRDFIAMVFPEYCLMCMDPLGRKEKLICLHCHYHLPKTNFHLDEDNELSKRFWGKVLLKYAWSYLKFTKQGGVQRVLHHLKYEDCQEVGELLGRWYGNELKECGLHKELDLILPIPLHASKLKKRGYNQSDTFAKGLAETMGLDWSATIIERNTASQTQTNKKRLERWENVKDIFTIKAEEAVFNKRILLVDDVVTTGSTFEACAKVLTEAGCKDVSIAAIASA